MRNAREIRCVCAVSLMLLGACKGVPIEYQVEARVVWNDLDAAEPTLVTNFAEQPEGQSVRFSPHGEVWANHFGLILDYQEASASTGLFASGSNLATVAMEESAIEAFLAYGFDTGAKSALDVYLGVRERRLDVNGVNRDIFMNFPTPIGESRSDTEAVVGLRFHHAFGPFTGHLRGDIGHASKLDSWLVGAGLTHDITEHLFAGVNFEYSEIDSEGRSTVGLEHVEEERSLFAAMLSFGFRF